MLAAIAYHQPITRDGLKDIFGKEISRDLIGRLHTRGLIGTGPRSPRRGAPYTYVTTEQFLVAFDLEVYRTSRIGSSCRTRAWSRKTKVWATGAVTTRPMDRL